MKGGTMKQLGLRLGQNENQRSTYANPILGAYLMELKKYLILNQLLFDVRRNLREFLYINRQIVETGCFAGKP